ncbi:Nif11-like leader peptide family natural product precursor [Ramlibacter terrae]|uniref:Nif11-like leader peptide family natural product n=1 Tax=Ramlibacter terrae TaxID=2732511 RepID=A0ABX6P0M3_9BURK|nr:Nif11-like leader peptide family natural product precursor [Ramlibacter terrae]
MSVEAVQAFRSLVAGDPALQKTCAAAIAARDPQRVVDAAAARGLVFTAAELQAVLADGELSDMELEMVAGGGSVAATGDEPTSVKREG